MCLVAMDYGLGKTQPLPVTLTGLAVSTSSETYQTVT